MGMRPSKKSMRRMVEKTHAMTALRMGMARDHRVGGQVEPHVTWVGQLLPGRKR